MGVEGVSGLEWGGWGGRGSRGKEGGKGDEQGERRTEEGVSILRGKKCGARKGNRRCNHD